MMLHEKVPSTNSADNFVMAHVIGSKLDDEDGNSLYARHYILEKHIHGTSNVYPRFAGSITVTKDAGAWAAVPGTKTEIIPASTVTLPFDIHWINVNTITANGEYVLVLYKGGAGSEVEIGAWSFVRTAVFSQEGSRAVITEIIPANTRISAALTGSPAGGESIKVKVEYHTY